MGKITGKRALVSGAGSGIGRGLAQRLVREGARVWVTDRDEARVKETFGSLGSYGAGMSVVDHTKADQVESLFNEVTGWAIPDILCCNVGAGLGSPIDKMTLEDWRWITDVNYWSTVYMLHYFVPAMKTLGQGNILITASVAGLIGAPAMSAYCGTKHALVGIAESLNAELASDKITVSALCPGIVNTNIIQDGKMELGSSSAKESIAEFYKTQGASPEQVAEDAIAGMKSGALVIPSPMNVWPVWLAKRTGGDLFSKAVGWLWSSGLLKGITGK